MSDSGSLSDGNNLGENEELHWTSTAPSWLKFFKSEPNVVRHIFKHAQDMLCLFLSELILSTGFGNGDFLAGVVG